MRLVADVGNTETVLGVVGSEPTSLEGHWRLSTLTPRTLDEFRHLLRGLLEADGFDPSAVDQVVIASVVPSTTGVLADALSALVSGPVHVVDGQTDLPIRLDVEEPRTVGADRIVNTLAAKVLYGRDTIAVDLGTATTYDCITADGVFVGGVISPGIESGLQWLDRHTAKLPRVELLPPERVIGRHTETCIQSGIFFSAIDAVDGTVRRIKAEWDRPDAMVVATGGFAPVIGPHCDSVELVEPFLTLYGCALAGGYLDEQRL
jgi:type III pantothenate kinase